MTACYQKSGICFLYPENWQITDEELRGSPVTVSVQSPTGGFWSLVVYDAQTEPSALVDQVLESMQGEYDDVESNRVEERFNDVTSQGYEMYFYCLDLLVSSRALAVRARGKTLLLLWQAEDREFDELEPVFRAMTFSLLNSERIG